MFAAATPENVPCPPFNVSDGTGTVTYYNGSGQLGTIAKYVCHEGFRLQGHITRRCEPPGQWSGTASFCIDNVEGLPTSPPASGHLLTFSVTRHWTGDYEYGGGWHAFTFRVTYVDAHVFGRLDGWFVWGTQEQEAVYLTGYFDVDKRLCLHPYHNVTGPSVFHSPAFGLDGELREHHEDTFVFTGHVTLEDFGTFAMWSDGVPEYDGHRVTQEEKSATITAVYVSLVFVLVFMMALCVLYRHMQETQSAKNGNRFDNTTLPAPTEPDYVVF